MPKIIDFEDETSVVNSDVGNGIREDHMSVVSSEGQEFASATQSPKDIQEIEMQDAPHERLPRPVTTGFVSVNNPVSPRTNGSPSAHKGTSNPQESDEAALDRLIKITPPHIVRKVGLANWRKIILGDAGGEIYFISQLIQNAKRVTLEQAMSNPSTQREVISALPPKVITEQVRKYIAKVDAQTLVTHLAEADRLGFSMDDIVGDGENVMPNDSGPHDDERYHSPEPSIHHRQADPHQFQHHPSQPYQPQLPPQPVFAPEPQRQVVNPPNQQSYPVQDRIQDSFDSPRHAESPQPISDGVLAKNKARLGGVCPDCGRTFTQKHSMQTHTEQRVCLKEKKEMDPAKPYDPSRTRYTCPGCDFKFAHPHAQEYHIERNHCGNVPQPDGSGRLPPRAPGPVPAAARTSGFKPINGASRSEESKKRLSSALAEAQTYIPAGSPGPGLLTPSVRPYQVDSFNNQPLGWSVPSRPSPAQSTPLQQSPAPANHTGFEEKVYDHLSPEKNREINAQFAESQRILEEDIRNLADDLTPAERDLAARRAKGRFYARNNTTRRQFAVPIQENRKKDKDIAAPSPASVPSTQSGKKRRGRPSRYDIAAYQAQASPIPPSQIVRTAQATTPSSIPRPPLQTSSSNFPNLPRRDESIPRPDWHGYPASTPSTSLVQNGRNHQENQKPEIKRPSFGSAGARPSSRSSENIHKRPRLDETPKTYSSENTSTSSEKRRVPIDAAQRKWERIQGANNIENSGASETLPQFHKREQINESHDVNGNTPAGDEKGKGKEMQAGEALYISSSDEMGSGGDSEEIPSIRPPSSLGGKGLISSPPKARMMARRGGGGFSPRDLSSRRGFGGRV